MINALVAEAPLELSAKTGLPMQYVCPVADSIAAEHARQAGVISHQRVYQTPEDYEVAFLLLFAAALEQKITSGHKSLHPALKGQLQLTAIVVALSRAA